MRSLLAQWLVERRLRSGCGGDWLEFVDGNLELGCIGVLPLSHVHADDLVSCEDAAILGHDGRDDPSAVAHTDLGSGYGSRRWHDLTIPHHGRGPVTAATWAATTPSNVRASPSQALRHRLAEASVSDVP